jgi:2-desacetyl-2-hydroxyethyl bacteriochlorophyllide A dehydrogenase
LKANALFFTAPHEVEVKEIDLGEPSHGQLVVRTEYSGISRGTELLAYRGEIDPALPLDETLGALSGTFEFPFQYGYSCVGVVERSYGAIPVGARVFSFHPHQDRLVVDDREALIVDVDASVATMYPLVETALQIVVDAAPSTGASVAVIGQGAVGILTALLLQKIGASVIASEPKEGNRKVAELVGLLCVDPDELPASVARATSGDGTDLVVEASGNPAGLRASLPLLKTNGVVVVASWYGTKSVELDLGREFHRRRLTIRSSQVSNLGDVRGWDRVRRRELALNLMRELPLHELTTHEFPFLEARQAYEALDRDDGGMIHVNLAYK